MYKDVFVPRFNDYLEALHLSVGHGEEIVFAKSVLAKVIVIRCHPWKHRVVLEQGFEVVDSGAQKQESCVQRFVCDILRGVVEVFVGVFDVAKDGQVGFEAIVAQGHYTCRKSSVPDDGWRV